MLWMLTYLLNRVGRYVFRLPANTSYPVIRELGILEECMEVGNREDLLMMCRVVFLESKREISSEHVLSAWEHIIRKRPILRMEIKEYHGKLYWCEMENLVPDIRFEDHGDWNACFENNSTLTFDSKNGPLWRVTFISNVKSPYTDHKNYKHQYALLCGFHHALFDGRSNLLVLNDFQHILNDLLQGTKLNLPDVVSAEYLDKPLDAYIRPPLTLSDKVQSWLLSIPGIASITRWILTCQMKKAFHQENLFMKHIGNFLLKSENKTSVKQIVLTKDESKKLFKSCKRQGVTVQSALQTASSLALCELLKHPVLSHNVEDIPNLLSVDVNCMLGMKGIVDTVPADSLGYFATVLHCKLDISEFSDFWTLASQSWHQIHGNQTFLAKDDLRKIYTFLKSKIRASDVLLGITSSGRYPGLLVAYSNLGNCAFLDMEESSEVRINGQVAACSEHKVGALFSHSVVTLLGCLHWNVGYYKNIESEEVVEFYVRECRRIVLKAIEEANETEN